MSAAAARRALSLAEAEASLRVVSTTQASLDLADFTLVEMWALCALAARARDEGKAPLAVSWSRSGPSKDFASAVGFPEVLRGTTTTVGGDSGRTVKLNRVVTEPDIQPLAVAVAELLAGDTHESARWTLQYVMIELLRNVVQHSDDALGGVVGAQLNDRGRHAAHPVYQVAVADNGRGIRASLARTHTEIDDDQVALDRSLVPYVSGAFAPGKSGGEENAGLGLFFISELAKALSGRLFLASGAASLLIDPLANHRAQFFEVGYPGTLVAFEVPVTPVEEFGVVFERIQKLAEERTPRRVHRQSLEFVLDPPERATRFAVAAFAENNDQAVMLAKKKLIPMLVGKEPFVLDFINVRLCTQSFAHALLADVVRYAWASRTSVFIVNATPVVRSALRHVETYAQGE